MDREAMSRPANRPGKAKTASLEDGVVLAAVGRAVSVNGLQMCNGPGRLRRLNRLPFEAKIRSRRPAWP